MQTTGSGKLQLKRALLPLLAVVLSGLLLIGWIRSVNAEVIHKLPLNSLDQSPLLIDIHNDISKEQQSTNRSPKLDVNSPALTKSSIPTTFAIGGVNYYNIAVSGNITHEIPVGQMKITDNLPAGVTWSPTSSASWNCVTGDISKVNCTNKSPVVTGTILIEALKFAVNLSPFVADTLTNIASLNYDSQVINSNSLNTVVEKNPFGFKIVKSSFPSVFTIGSNNRYIINVSRAITGTLTTNLIIEDDLPSGLTWTPINTIGIWDCSSSTTTKVSCFNANAVPVNTTALDPINIVVNVPTNISSDTVFNTASLQYGNLVLGSSITTTIKGADLEISKALSPSLVTSYTETIKYTLVITNNGPFAALNAVITETLPSDINPFTSVSITSKPPTITINNINDLKFTVPLFPNEGIITITLETKPKPSALGKIVTNYASVKSDTNDWDTSNNSASASFSIGRPNISKAVSTNDTIAGKPFTYTIAVTNPNDFSLGVNVIDTFTKTLDILACKIKYIDYQSPCDHDITDHELRSYLYLIGHGTANVVVSVRGNRDIGLQPKTIKNTAYVTTGAQNVAFASNEVTTVVKPAGYIQVNKEDNLSTVYPGQRITYTVSLSNSGSLNVLSPITIADSFSNLVFVSINKNGLTMDQTSVSGYDKAWKITGKTLAPGEKITFYLSFDVSSGAANGSSTTNTINVTAKDTADNQIDATDTDINTVSFASTGAMSILKSVTPEQAKVGDSFTFNIVLHNNGNETVSNLRVNDYFPDALDLTSATTSRGTAAYSASTGEVEVTIPSMGAGEKTTIVITAKVSTDVKAPKTYRNRAYLKWPGVSEFSSNQVAFRVLPTGFLPGTGGVGTLSAAASNTPALVCLFSLSGLLLLAGLVMSGVYLWMRRNKPLTAGKYAAAAAILVTLAVLGGLGGSLLAAQTGKPPLTQLLQLSGPKPPLAATQARLPASTNPPPAKEPTLPADETEEPVLLLPVRPTPETPPPAHDSNQPTPTLTTGEVDISHLLPTPTPLSLPDYTIPTPSAMPPSGPDGGAPDGSPVTRIEIPRMDLNTNVKYVPFNGSTWLISGLKQEVAWMGDTSWPGLGSNTGLAGHVDLVTGERGPFWNLQSLKPGDEVKLYTTSKIYTYRVRTQAVVDDTDTSVIQPTDKPQLTLITCTGWDTAVRIYLKRLIVFADFISASSLSTMSN